MYLAKQKVHIHTHTHTYVYINTHIQKRNKTSSFEGSRDSETHLQCCSLSANDEAASSTHKCHLRFGSRSSNQEMQVKKESNPSIPCLYARNSFQALPQAGYFTWPHTRLQIVVVNSKQGFLPSLSIESRDQAFKAQLPINPDELSYSPQLSQKKQ